MRCPSTKKLVDTFQITTQKANLIRRIAKAAEDGDALKKVIDKSCPETASYVAGLHSDPYHSRMWRTTVALHAMDKVLDSYGVEGLGEGNHYGGYAPPYEYLNMGDTYATTLIYKRSTDNLFIGNWGDIVERESL